MSALGTVLVAVVLVVGILGAVVQVWPSAPLIGGAILVWAIAWNRPAAWVVAAVALLVLLVATVAKYLVPGRRLRRAGIPDSTLLWGLAGAVVGFFVVPVLGFVVGLVLGVHLAELVRLGSNDRAWPATVEALRALGLAVVIEVLAALVATAAWVVGLFLV